MTTKPTKVKIDPKEVDKDIERFSTRYANAKLRPIGTAGFASQHDSAFPSRIRDDSTTVAGAAQSIRRYRSLAVRSGECQTYGKAYSFPRGERIPTGRTTSDMLLIYDSVSLRLRSEKGCTRHTV